jgi:cold shock CspA family protein
VKPSLSGRVTQWRPDQGYGFLKIDGSGESLFLHAARLQAAGLDPLDIAVGETRLRFDRVPSRKCPGKYEAGGMIQIISGAIPPPTPWWLKEPA